MLAPHIVGRVGPIFADELDAYLGQNRGYTREDAVGKEGIEKAFEATLRGTDGLRRINLDAEYKVVSVTDEVAATPGNSVVLTIDSHIQKTATDALKAQIENLRATAKEGEGKEANAGCPCCHRH
jgi:penicillin-binding protein 2